MTVEHLHRVEQSQLFPTPAAYRIGDLVGVRGSGGVKLYRLVAFDGSEAVLADYSEWDSSR